MRAVVGVADPDGQGPEFRAAFERRENVGLQVADILRERSFPGSRAQLAERLRDVARYEAIGELSSLRAALVDLAVASGAWAADLDARIPPDPPRRSRRKV